MWEALINVVMAIGTPTWISKMVTLHRHKRFCAEGLPVATNPTKVISREKGLKRRKDNCISK